ncbi:MAG: adenylyltransferase/cytidyltransferase family protein [Bacteroidales bacterium]|nr:adenylyltransferase/cytidyltransferase family protein [Bacteroidales bacterium]
MFERIRSKVLDVKNLPLVRKNNPGKKIVFCTGCYDILQSGHAVFFNQCREFGDILVVGVGRDVVISQLKGPGRPVNPENNRVYLVASLLDVDFAVLNDETILPGKIDFKNILEELRPDVFILNDDDSGLDSKKAICDKLGISISFVQRVVPEELEPTSTTRIIDKINFSYKAPLRIDFAGGWTDVPYIMDGEKGFVSNVAIKPFIEYKAGRFNFSGYPRGSGLSTSTAAKLLEMLSAKNYNSESKSLSTIAEDLFNLENKNITRRIGRQDQYSIVYGGFNCFEFGQDYANPLSDGDVSSSLLEKFRHNLLLLHTGVSRNAQLAVEQVYQNYKSASGKDALLKIAEYGKLFYHALKDENFVECARIMEMNFEAQKQLAPATSNEYLDSMYSFAKANGAFGGKICGAGGGGAFIFYCEDPASLKRAMKKQFVDCFEIDFEFEYSNIKSLNTL